MKTSKKDFELFKKECKKWIDIFELNCYKIAYKWEQDPDADASIYSKEDGKIATIYFCRELVSWDGYDYCLSKNEYIKGVAKHEIIHLLLSRYSWNAESRFINKNELFDAEEELVRKLENIIK